jgi:transposase-like protein
MGDKEMKNAEKRIQKKYSEEEKNKIIGRMLPPESATLRLLETEYGIGKSTLSTWRHKVIQKQGLIVASGNNKNHSAGDKFLTVIESYGMNESELSQYCRAKGLYTEEVKGWQDTCIHANEKPDSLSVEKTNKELRQELNEEKTRSKALEKELNRKEKALAEAAALLMLRKKVEAIWGEKEDE